MTDKTEGNKVNLDSVKATIAKLITLANNAGATENEAKVAMERAKKLMAKYSLEEASIMREKIKQGIEVEAQYEAVDTYYYSKQTDWEHRLGWGIAEIFECKGVRGHEEYDHEEKDWTRKMHFVGMPNDIALVLYFYDYCQNEIALAMEISYKKNGNVRKKNQFACGMVARIIERLTEFYKRYKEEVSTTTMDIVVYKKDAVDKKYAQVFPNTVPSRLKSVYSSDYFAGRKAGEHVHLSSNLNQIK